MTVKISKISKTTPIELPLESWSKMVLTKGSVGAQKLSMGVSCFKPGLKTALMVHEEEELAYVLQGKGKIELKGGKNIDYEAGDGIYIPAGVAHSVINDGIEDVMMVACFSWPEYPPTHKESQ
jgi:quercetin dioxygenase-like cupin family protein